MKELPIVIISEPIHPVGMDMLKGKVRIKIAPDTLKATAMSMAGDADAVILRATTVFDKEVIDRCVRTKVIARTGVGVDNVDLRYAGEKGIYVCNTPGTNTETVAEHVAAMILALSKQVIFMDRAVRLGRWQERFSPAQRDLKGKKLGIVGLGKTGLATARLCQGLGMEVLAYDPFVSRVEGGIVMTSELSALFRDSDFVSLHCPATAETHRFIGKAFLESMKPEAFFINASRGDLVDPDALVAVLKEGTIAGAALDVFENEPPALDNPLLGLSNVILSPHVAGSTRESNERIAIAAVQAVLDVLEGKTPANICNLNFFPVAYGK
jgi:D-3-phosphoglycerate dehydrogenase